MVNPIILLHKENGFKKKKKKKGKEKEKNIDHSSACIQSPASNCFYAHMFCYLRMQLSVLYAIAESKAII